VFSIAYETPFLVCYELCDPVEPEFIGENGKKFTNFQMFQIILINNLRFKWQVAHNVPRVYAVPFAAYKQLIILRGKRYGANSIIFLKQM
jgi:hypothetical protein